MIQNGLEGMFVEVNDKVGTIASQVGQTPQGWNAGVFNLIQNLSQTVIVPIAGLIITFVLCYELITMVTQKNNFHEFETYNIFLWIFKAYVAIYLVTNTFNITMAVFDVGQHIVNGAAGVISGSTAVDASAAISTLTESLEDMEIGELFLLAMETLLISLTMSILSVIITVIMYGRMIEIYLYTSVAPIPFATMTNKEWGNIGNNYLKGLFALAFQGFFMLVCVGIYSVLVNAMTISTNLHGQCFQWRHIRSYWHFHCLRPEASVNQYSMPTDGQEKKGVLPMAYVPVPKDLTKVKTKVALNLTKRQLIFFSLAAVVGVPLYLLAKKPLGSSVSAILMVTVMLPFFFMAMYEKDGLPFEKVMGNIIRQKFLCPAKRPYKTENFYQAVDSLVKKEGVPDGKKEETGTAAVPGSGGKKKPSGKKKKKRQKGKGKGKA